MSDSNTLRVWLRGERLGMLTRLRNGGLRMRFDDEAVTRWGEGSQVLSLSLPLTTRRVEGPRLDRFLNNLLPESPIRAQLEREHRLRPGDTFGLLAAVGAECAGAVQFIRPESEPSSGTLLRLTDDEATRIVGDLPTIEAPEGATVSASLGGVQAKVLLTRDAGGWAWPTEGAISTHIIKPEPLGGQGLEGIIRYEEWALRLARAAGLEAAEARLEQFGDREAIVVTRFDRVQSETGVRRRHQEDFAQALGIDAHDKYEGSGTSPGRLATLARAVVQTAFDDASLLVGLLRQVAFNVIIGNGDAHAKNYSFVIDDNGYFSLAPLYDVAPVFLVSRAYRHTGFAIAGRNRLDLVTRELLIEEARSWGVATNAAARVIAETAERIGAALNVTPTDGLPLDIAHSLRDRLAQWC